MIVSISDYIIACIGLFLSDFKNNDVAIMQDILLRSTENILSWIEEVVFVLKQ